MFKPILFTCRVLSDDIEEKVVMLKKDKFYKKLEELRIRNSEREISKLS